MILCVGLIPTTKGANASVTQDIMSSLIVAGPAPKEPTTTNKLKHAKVFALKTRSSMDKYVYANHSTIISVGLAKSVHQKPSSTPYSASVCASVGKPSVTSLANASLSAPSSKNWLESNANARIPTTGFRVSVGCVQNTVSISSVIKNAIVDLGSGK